MRALSPPWSRGSSRAARKKSGVIDRTRPLCVYPKTARYKGTGSMDEAANFSCAKP